MDKNQITVKFVNKKDIQNCVKLAIERDLNTNRPKRHSYWKKLFNRLTFSKKLLIAIVEKKLVGFCYFSPFLYEDNRNFYVQLIYVRNKDRKKGIAKSLFKELEKIAKKEGGNRLFSSCDLDNSLSIKMHEKLGFERCGFIKNISRYGEKEIFYSKRI